MTTENKSQFAAWFGQSWVWLLAGTVSLAILPGANAQQPQPQRPLLGAAQEDNSQQEVQQYCGSIVDPARDQRYLMQKQELDKLQADVNQRISALEARKAEYEDWLKRRNDFLQKAKAGLVDIYKTSKADAAAQQFNEMDINIAAAIIMQLPARQSGLILSEMDAAKAAMVAAIMSSASNPNTSRDPS
jgi:flagellar motility protein MotE (MotC chaperone)